MRLNLGPAPDALVIFDEGSDRNDANALETRRVHDALVEARAAGAVPDFDDGLELAMGRRVSSCVVDTTHGPIRTSLEGDDDTGMRPRRLTVGAINEMPHLDTIVVLSMADVVPDARWHLDAGIETCRLAAGCIATSRDPETRRRGNDIAQALKGWAILVMQHHGMRPTRGLLRHARGATTWQPGRLTEVDQRSIMTSIEIPAHLPAPARPSLKIIRSNTETLIMPITISMQEEFDAVTTMRCIAAYEGMTP